MKLTKKQIEIIISALGYYQKEVWAEMEGDGMSERAQEIKALNALLITDGLGETIDSYRQKKYVKIIDILSGDG